MSRSAMCWFSAVFFPICGIAFGAYWFCASHGNAGIQMPEDVVLQEFGRFFSSKGKYSLTIDRRPSGSTSIIVLRNDRSGIIPTEPYPVFETGARMTEDWFFAMDRYQRIWIYVGASSNRKTGRPAPSVYMLGPTFGASGIVLDVIQEVSRTGDWIGVPESFLTRIHAAAHQDDDFKNLPKASPAFTPERLKQLAAAAR